MFLSPWASTFSFREWSFGSQLPSESPRSKFSLKKKSAFLVIIYVCADKWVAYDGGEGSVKKRSNCAPGTQTTSTEDVFTVVCGVDFPGNDMFITPAVSITQCLEFCAGYHPLCMSFSLSLRLQ
jgi:hypothetical protein